MDIHLKEIRKKLGITQIALCQLLNITQGSLAKYEIGLRRFPVSQAKRLIELCKERGIKITLIDIYGND